MEHVPTVIRVSPISPLRSRSTGMPVPDWARLLRCYRLRGAGC
jgi:hypothetical protein